jgi:hypothetical protein
MDFFQGQIRHMVKLEKAVQASNFHPEWLS